MAEVVTNEELGWYVRDAERFKLPAPPRIFLDVVRRADAKEAENASLREALEAMLDDGEREHGPTCGCSDPKWCKGHQFCWCGDPLPCRQMTARAALAPSNQATQGETR